MLDAQVFASTDEPSEVEHTCSCNGEVVLLRSVGANRLEARIAMKCTLHFGLKKLLTYNSEASHFGPSLNFWTSPASHHNLLRRPVYGHILLLPPLLIYHELLKSQGRSYIALQSIQVACELPKCCEMLVAAGFGQVIDREVTRLRSADRVWED